MYSTLRGAVPERSFLVPPVPSPLPSSTPSLISALDSPLHLPLHMSIPTHSRKDLPLFMPLYALTGYELVDPKDKNKINFPLLEEFSNK